MSGQHAAVHVQRLSAPAARDLASQWPEGPSSRRSRDACTAAAAGHSSNGADAASAANGTGPSHAAHSGRPADGSGSSPSNAPGSQTPHTAAGSSSSDSTTSGSSSNSGRQSAADSAAAGSGGGVPKDLPKRRDRKGRLSKADIYGGQYHLRSNTDWVEPWVTQTIPEDRLPRWEGKFCSVLRMECDQPRGANWVEPWVTQTKRIACLAGKVNPDVFQAPCQDEAHKSSDCIRPWATAVYSRVSPASLRTSTLIVSFGYTCSSVCAPQ